jgi:hypothetical protein
MPSSAIIGTALIRVTRCARCQPYQPLFSFMAFALFGCRPPQRVDRPSYCQPCTEIGCTVDEVAIAADYSRHMYLPHRPRYRDICRCREKIVAHRRG